MIFLVPLILILALNYSNYTTEKKHKYEIEKIEEKLAAEKEKDSLENKKD